MSRRPLLAAALVAAAGTLALSLPAGTAGAEPGAHDRADSTGAVAEVRKAIAPYRDVSAALAAGYVPVSPCESSAEGGMGVHYMHLEAASDLEVELARPEILLFGSDGRLLGAEYWQADRGQEHPTLAGQPFDGPMEGHGPEGQMPWHYDLHVWTEVANPAGVFAPYNPRVRC